MTWATLRGNELYSQIQAHMSAIDNSSTCTVTVTVITGHSYIRSEYN